MRENFSRIFLFHSICQIVREHVFLYIIEVNNVK